MNFAVRNILKVVARTRVIDLYVNSREELDALLIANGVAEADVVSTTDAIWAELGYANAAAFDAEIYGAGILKSVIVAAIPSATSPGTANLVAAYDFDDSSGTGQNDSSGNGLNLTENGTSTWDTGTPTTYRGATSSDYLSSSGLSSNWGNASGDWTLVVRFKDAAINRGPFAGGGGRHYINWTSGGYYEGRIGASVAANLRITPTSSYTGQFVTIVLQFDSGTGYAKMFFLNENKEDTDDSGFTPSWSGSEAQIGASSGDGGTIDYAYFFDRILTENERKWFGDNSSEAIEFSDL